MIHLPTSSQNRSSFQIIAITIVDSELSDQLIESLTTVFKDVDLRYGMVWCCCVVVVI